MANDSDKVKQLQNEVSRLNAQIKQTAILQAEKNRVEKEYQLSQKRYRTVFEESAVGKKIVNDQLKIIKVNKALLQMLGYSEDELSGKLITDFAHPNFLAEWKRLQYELWTTQMTTFNFDTCLLKKDGEVIWVHVTTILIEDNGQTLGYTILEDISVRKDFERLAAKVREQEQRQQLAEAILNTQEKERKRVSENLHNGLGQMLYGVKLSLSQIEIKDAGNKAAVQYTEQLINESINECRRISHQLMPVILEEYGLSEAVKTICHQLSDTVQFKYSIKGLAVRLDRFLEVAVYRIIQELMLNIVKHAEATMAEVDVTASENAIQIIVGDNGKGLGELSKRKEGIGLQAIRDKVSLLSGKISLFSEKGEGTRIKINIPKRVD